MTECRNPLSEMNPNIVTSEMNPNIVALLKPRTSLEDIRKSCSPILKRKRDELEVTAMEPFSETKIEREFLAREVVEELSTELYCSTVSLKDDPAESNRVLKSLGLTRGCGSVLVSTNLLPPSTPQSTADSVAAFLTFIRWVVGGRLNGEINMKLSNR